MVALLGAWLQASRTEADRRFYINSFVMAEHCDHGEWALRGGQPVPLGEGSSLVHYEALHERPEPHFIEE
ncbi:hypothetical protein [uncultured Ferrovibrio sp.]|uniref:hypothetical protein n=1 Tax=uncultured Ferrovibrio sp. TaxID=1576913 RepID=UPI002606E5C6|nr:hypothetical protein [uncultured Ferrovibrio sp.]